MSPSGTPSWADLILYPTPLLKVINSRLFKKLRFVKILRHIPSTTESPVVTNIYANKIAIVIWSEVPEVILIENQKATEAYRDYFNFMWKSAEK